MYLANREVLVVQVHPYARVHHPFRCNHHDRTSLERPEILGLQAHRLYQETQAYPFFLYHLSHRTDLADRDLPSLLWVLEDLLLLEIPVVP